MLKSWKIGYAFGIPLFIHPTFLLLPLLVVMTQRGGGWGTTVFMLALTLLVFACVLLHELGHALMARYYGIGTRDITLYPIGGVARLERMTSKPTEELLIALAGPAVNVVIAGLLTPLVLFAISTGVLRGDPVLVSTDMSLWAITARFLLALWISNIVLVIFNLLPAFPLDGGRVLRAFLAMGLGTLKATEIASAIGLGMAGLFALGAVFLGNIMLFVVAIFVVFAGQQELLYIRQREAMKYQPLDAFPIQEPVFPPLPAQPTVGFPTHLPSGSTNGHAGYTGYTWDRYYQVWVRWQDGRPVAAYWGHAE